MMQLLVKGKQQQPSRHLASVHLLIIRRIPIHERVELPESWMPEDSRVEIDAKITAGEFPPPPYIFDRVDRADLGTRLLYHWPPYDGRRTCSSQGQNLGGVSCPFER